MTPQQLKDSILQLAVEGKLVPQIESEGTAEDLYIKIKNKEYDYGIGENCIPYEIPNNWKWVPLLSVIEIATNLVDSKKYNDFPHIAPDSIEKSSGKLLFVHSVLEDKVESPNHLFHKGQIIYSKIRPLLRKAVIAQFDGLCSADMYPLNTKIYNSYVLYYLLSNAFNNQIALIMSNRVKMPKVNQKELSKVLFPLPPLAEQKRIVEKIEELLPLVDKYGEAYNQLSELEEKFPSDLKKSILQYAMEGKLVPQIESEGTAEDLYQQIQKEKALKIKNGEIKKEKPLDPITEDEIPFDIPQSWKWVRLGEICKFVFSGKSPIYDTTNRNYMCLGQASNKEEGIDYSLCKYVTKDFYDSSDDYQRLQYGDVLLNTLGGGTVGRSGIFDKEELSNKILTDGHLFVFRLFDIDTAFFLLDYLRLNRANIEKNAEGSTNQCFLKKTEVSKYVIPLPPLSEQKRIVDKIEELFKIIDKE